MAEDPRRAEPGQEFGYTDADGNQVTRRADAETGLIRPRNAEETRLFDSFDLPVARTTSKKKAEAPEPTPEPADTKGPGHPDAGKE